MNENIIFGKIFESKPKKILSIKILDELLCWVNNKCDYMGMGEKHISQDDLIEKINFLKIQIIEEIENK
jgi:hypothetical protein